MKGKRHSEEQIIAIVKQSEAGMKTVDVCRQAGVSEQTFYRWKAKYGGLAARGGSHAGRVTRLSG